MVVKDKKTDIVHIYVYLRKLNNACLYDPFRTLFVDKVLKSVIGKEAYSLIDGFSRYHQIRIAKEN